ncbi:MAG TPA: peptidylprolyl isomerase [Candidatus Acidoferrales bacterium]|nr:peptidylprolyl isomerase [Candidatus Acidoferrales bacterium]
MKARWSFLLIPFVCAHLAAQTKGRVVEEIIARVNNEVITSSDLQRAHASLEDEVKQECRNCSPEQLRSAVTEKQKNLLRDLIDQSLLVQRGKDLGIGVETDVVKRLDQIRQQNSIASMEDLEKRVNESGLSFEDFKNNIRNSLLTQEVIRREVGSKIIIGHDEVVKYYEEHKNSFQRPEQVYLREIFISTDGKKESEIPDLEKKMRGLLQRINNGEDFAELAKRYSDGTTAKSGGELGVFERGQLAKDIEDVVFKLDKGKLTDVIRTKTGFLALKVEQRYEAGLQPLEKVENEVMNRLYEGKMEPALRDYLKELRQESYVVVKPGYVDTAAVASAPIEEVQVQPESQDSKKKGKRHFPFIGKKKKEGQ